MKELPCTVGLVLRPASVQKSCVHISSSGILRKIATFFGLRPVGAPRFEVLGFPPMNSWGTLDGCGNQRGFERGAGMGVGELGV